MAADSQHSRLSTALADLSDGELISLISRAEPLGVGIGGSTARVSVGGCDVFLKQLPLTAMEQDDPTSTANTFGLPAACHYGIASPGFGVGREIAAHELTSNRVTAGATDMFPVLHHWRMVDQPCGTDLSELTDDAAQRRWGTDWPRVRGRVDALATAQSSVALFLEWAPVTLHLWLRQRFAEGRGSEALSQAMKQVVAATAWMGANGLQHLDLHPRNILVCDGRLLFTDFGLALHEGFDMDDDERSFFASHHRWDHDTAISSLLHWALAEAGLGSRAERLEVLRAAASDPRTVGLDAVRAELGSATELIAHYAAVGVVTTTRFDDLMLDASSSP